MSRVRLARIAICVLLLLPALIGCAARNTYRLDLAPVVTQGEFSIIQNFGTADIDTPTVDALLLEIAGMLEVTLDRSIRKVRVVVTSPDQISGLALAINSTPAGKVSAMAPGHYVEALYLPKASIALIPYFDRVMLGHELAHYVTDHYLTQTPLDRWEAIAERVEQKLWVTKAVPTPPAPSLPSVVLAQDASLAAEPSDSVLVADDGAPVAELPVGLAEDTFEVSWPVPLVVAEDTSVLVEPVPTVVLAAERLVALPQ